MLVYADRTAEQFVHREELEALAREAGTELVLVLDEPPAGWTGETGRIDRAMLGRLFGTPERRQWLFLLCGPVPMLKSVEESLMDIGVPSDRILAEKFNVSTRGTTFYRRSVSCAI